MLKLALYLSILSLSGGVALANDSGKGDSAAKSKKMPMMMSTEQRAKMAEAHEKMAVCLRSDRPLKECHEEMMKACKEGMGKDGCPMAGHMDGHMMHHDE